MKPRCSYRGFMCGVCGKIIHADTNTVAFSCRSHVAMEHKAGLREFKDFWFWPEGTYFSYCTEDIDKIIAREDEVLRGIYGDDYLKSLYRWDSYYSLSANKRVPWHWKFKNK